MGCGVAQTGVVADSEVLRDEGVAYFAAVQAAGGNVAYREYEHAFHAFPIFPFPSVARREANAFVRTQLRAAVSVGLAEGRGD